MSIIADELVHCAERAIHKHTGRLGAVIAGVGIIVGSWLFGHGGSPAAVSAAGGILLIGAGLLVPFVRPRRRVLMLDVSALAARNDPDARVDHLISAAGDLLSEAARRVTRRPAGTV